MFIIEKVFKRNKENTLNDTTLRDEQYSKNAGIYYIPG